MSFPVADGCAVWVLEVLAGAEAGHVGVAVHTQGVLFAAACEVLGDWGGHGHIDVEGGA